MRKDIVFWVVGTLLLVLTLTGINYAATFLLSENRALQEEIPPRTAPVRFDLDKLVELGISATGTASESATSTEIIPVSTSSAGNAQGAGASGE